MLTFSVLALDLESSLIRCSLTAHRHHTNGYCRCTNTSLGEIPMLREREMRKSLFKSHKVSHTSNLLLNMLSKVFGKTNLSKR